jgi:DNA-binding transcriptional MerR regulator
MSRKDGFEPGVAARITGVTTNVQRLWAQRYPGLIAPSTGNHRRFSISDLCRLRAARLMADGGILLHRIERSLTEPVVAQLLLSLRDYERGNLAAYSFLAIPSDDSPARMMRWIDTVDEVTGLSPMPVTLVDLAAIGRDLGARLAVRCLRYDERADEVRP